MNDKETAGKAAGYIKNALRTAISGVRYASTAMLAYLSDAAHRRAVATVVAFVTTHIAGKALDADQLTLYLEIAIGGLGGAWSSRTPKLEQPE